MEYVYTDPEADPSGQEFVIKKKAASMEEAKRLAKAKLRELNLRAVTGTLDVAGNVGYVAGVVLELSGFGAWDWSSYEDALCVFLPSGTENGFVLGTVYAGDVLPLKKICLNKAI